MATIPTTQYAKRGDVHIAYQVVGDGAQNLVFVPGWVSHFEYAWEEPSLAVLARLAFSRLILLDQRGTGSRIVVNAASSSSAWTTCEQSGLTGADRAAVFSVSKVVDVVDVYGNLSGTTAALVLYGTFARMLRAPDYRLACLRRC